VDPKPAVLKNESLRIPIDADAWTGRVLNAKGEEITNLIALWFAFHPNTDW
jgi:hypothetical protein